MDTENYVSKILRWLPFTLLGQAKGKISRTEKTVLIGPQICLPG